jgi:hypothetical protein
MQVELSTDGGGNWSLLTDISENATSWIKFCPTS